MFLLCLIAALSGTPLRQAEAADDFARTFGECGQSDVLHTVDGGVGDDKEVSEIAETDYFQTLRSRAQEMRGRYKTAPRNPQIEISESQSSEPANAESVSSTPSAAQPMRSGILGE